MNDLLTKINHLPDNPIIAIGGFLTLRKPVALIQELIKTLISDITILSLSGSFEIDLILKAQIVKEIIAPYVGGESICPITPIYKEVCKNGLIISEPWDTAQLVKALSSNLDQSGIASTIGTVDTDIPLNNRRIRQIAKLIEIDPIKPDFALLHCSYSDKAGNAYIKGASWGDLLIAQVSDFTAISVEEEIDAVDSNCSDELIPADHIDYLEIIPRGASPFLSPGYYDVDTEKLKSFAY